MDEYDNEEVAFCEESRPGEALEENESEFLQAVFDEEDAIFSADAVAPIREESLYKMINSNGNVRRSTVSTKKEVWIVNPKLTAKRKICSSTEAFDTEEKISPDDQQVLLKNLCQEVPKEIKVEEELSSENGSKSSKKMGSFLTSKKIKVKKNLINNNNYCNFCGKEFCKDKLLKDHIKNCGCNENSLKYCDLLCIEKFARRSSRGFSVKLDHSYSKPDDIILQCNLCGLNFNETNHLQVHLRTKHVLQLREILKNCFHLETRNDLKEDSLIVQLLPDDRNTKVKVETKDESLK